MSYRLVRVNDDKHTTRMLAVKDMRDIIDHGYYWKRSDRISLPQGTMLIGMGSHKGRGLFIVGVVKTGKWKNADDGRYGHKIAVSWSNVVYEVPVTHLVVPESLPGFSVYQGCYMNQVDFRHVMNMILEGQAIDPWNYGTEAVAA